MRFDRYKSSTLRSVIFAPGRFDGESDADREDADIAAQALAESARFSETATPLDLTAPDPGCPFVMVEDFLLFTLPPKWTAAQNRMGDIGPSEGAQEGLVRRKMHCRSPDGRIEMDVTVTAVETAEADREEPMWAATNSVVKRCQELFENGIFEEDTEINPFQGIPHTTGVLHYAADRASASGFVRLHAFVGPERSIFAEFQARGPTRRQKARDRRTLQELDDLLANAQPWHAGLADIRDPEKRAGGAPNWPDDAETGMKPEIAVADVGLGMLRLPIPPGWRWSPDPPFGGELAGPDGQVFDLTVQSYFDPKAHTDRERLMEYTLEDEFDVKLPEGADPFANFLISISGEIMKGAARGEKPIMLKSLEPFGKTHIRELRLSAMVPEGWEPMEVFASMPEYLAAAKWSRDTTPLDRIAPSEQAKQVSLDHWIFFRIPADWTFIPKDRDNASADDPDGLETLWITARLFELPGDRLEPPDMLRMTKESLARVHEGELGDVEVEWLNDKDIVGAIRSFEEEDGMPLRRIHRVRLIVFDKGACVLQFSHVTDRNTRDEKRDWTERFIKESLATAVVLPEAR